MFRVVAPHCEGEGIKNVGDILFTFHYPDLTYQVGRRKKVGGRKGSLGGKRRDESLLPRGID